MMLRACEKREPLFTTNLYASIINAVKIKKKDSRFIIRKNLESRREESVIRYTLGTYHCI